MNAEVHMGDVHHPIPETTVKMVTTWVLLCFLCSHVGHSVFTTTAGTVVIAAGFLRKIQFNVI